MRIGRNRSPPLFHHAVMTPKIIIRDTHRGALYEDGVFKEILGPGSYKLRTSMWSPVKREIVQVDIRDRSLTIKGQEILTADKVAVRVSILVNFRVTDVKAALHNVQSYEDRIYEDVQISTRRFLAVRTLDEILKDRARADEEVNKIKLDADKAVAQQLEGSPTLLRLRELEALETMAKHGGNKFVIGLGDGFSKLMSEE